MKDPYQDWPSQRGRRKRRDLMFLCAVFVVIVVFLWLGLSFPPPPFVER